MFTGYEYVYGKYTDSYLKSPAYYKVVDVIVKDVETKFGYMYIVQDMETLEYDILDIKHYESLAEIHGYIRPLKFSNFKIPGMFIKKDELIYKTNNHDDYDNYRYGVNAKVAYLAISETIEDGIVVSKSFAERVKFNAIKEYDLTVGFNELLLNIYGDDDNYKSFPDIGEKIDNNVVCVKRKLNKQSVIYELTKSSLQKKLLTDSTITSAGHILDISAYINNSDTLDLNGFNAQIKQYHDKQIAYHDRIIEVLGKITRNKKNMWSYKLLSQLRHSVDFVDSELNFGNNTGVFEFALLKFTVLEEHKLKPGYKLTDRYGGKGVIVAVWDDDKMPINEQGVRSEMIISPASVPSRANIGQSYEHELNYISEERQREIILESSLPKKFNILREYISLVNPEQAEHLIKFYKVKDTNARKKFMQSVETGGIYLHQAPFGTDITLDQMELIYRYYGTKPTHIYTQRTIDDQTFKFKSNRPVIISDKYMIVLEHTPPGKFSTRSIGSVNYLGFPVKSKHTLITNTAVKYSELALYNSMTRIEDISQIYRLFTTHANSPGLRAKLVKMLLTKNPFELHNLEKHEINKEDTQSIAAKQLKAILYSIGLEKE